ncbi:LysR family transcriptional regulator [Allopusillimonas soli]|uniref:LysR family transcriptional regulator n=1 Tax=Allopusillimonas soli TaxID=659016 RepID=A0A853F8G4_9BURK|nr:LysR substrate-binding domain-containing protein [Allopusillimonas soli]NYT36277.1 LysR family transcriptional regulator [Allopusillimonas soli]TEA76601.1 LysR family transcriptional regulator [Allopusillimonas soli]
MLKVRQLKAFHALMITGTVTDAAARMRISQPAISTLIASLERDIGFNLFMREKNRLRPTDEARYFHEAVIAAIDRLDSVERLAVDIRESHAGSLRIAALPMLALDFLPRVLAQFLNNHPQVSVVLQARSSPTVAKLIATQQFDLGFSELPFESNWVDAEILAVRCVCVLPIGHPLSNKKVISPVDLKDQPLITAPREHVRTQRLMEVFSNYGITPTIRVETPLFASMCAFVIAGGGIGIVDPITAQNFSEHGLIVLPFEPALFSEFGILFPSSKPRTLIAQKFAALARETILQYTS